MIHHKLMHEIQRRDGRYLLAGMVRIDDAYFGSELIGGKAGCESENKVSFVAAVEFNEARRPIRMKMSRVNGFTTSASSSWAKSMSQLVPKGSQMGWRVSQEWLRAAARILCRLPKAES